METIKTKESIKAIIVDDELHARENLRFLIEESIPEIEIAGTAEGVNSAFDLFKRTSPDLIFLDIRMPSGTEGFDLLEKLEGENFKVVFVTAFKDYAIRAFERRALHYILKPVDEEDLKETLIRVKNQSEDDQTYSAKLENLKGDVNSAEEPERLTVNHSKGIRIIEIKALEYLESSGNCTVLHFKDGTEFLDTRTLKVYEALLPKHFFRVHRSFIVNLKEVVEILYGNDQSAKLKTGKAVSISRDRKKELVNAIRALQ